MPAIQNPWSLAKSKILQEAVSSLIVHTGSEMLLNETPVTAPTAGYKAYIKRMERARKAVLHPELFVLRLSEIIAICYENIELDNNANYRRLLMDNPGWTNALYQKFNPSTGLNGGINGIGSQMIDLVAGVDQSDLI